MIGKLDYLPETPSQTAGPYVHIGLIPQQAGFEIFENSFGNVMAGRNTAGERIRIEGHVLDGAGSPCRDVLLEAWQANAAGRYNHPADRQADKALDADFRGWEMRVGHELPRGTRFLDLTRARNRNLEPDSVRGEGPGSGTLCAMAAARLAPEANLQLIRIDPALSRHRHPCTPPTGTL